MISVYNSDEKLFNNNGIKILKPMKALLYKQDNGDYSLSLKDTIDNIDYYQAGMIIRVPTPWGKQAFRLSNPNLENKKITVKAKHIYFDTENYNIFDSYIVNKNCNDALDHLKLACDTPLPFNVISDITKIASYRCVRQSYKEAVNTIIDYWGGHLVRDNFNIEIRDTIGEDRGVTLEAKKNITSMKTIENWDNVITKILPVGKDGLTLPEKYITYNQNIYVIPYTKTISFDQSNIAQDDYQDDYGNFIEDKYNEALIEDLRNKANEHLKNNYLPKINYTLSAYLKNVSDVGDVIHVKHPKCKVDITTNVIAIEYDVIKQEYTKIEFGNFTNKLKNLIKDVKKETMKDVTTANENAVAKMKNNLEIATQKITDKMSKSYVIYDGDKILIVDKLPKEEATNVILINNGGIGFSENGINGNFKSAWTIDGTLDMQNINVINLVADMIKGGTLKLGSNLNESGILELYDTSNNLIGLFNNEGLTVYCADRTYIKLNPKVGVAGYDSDNNKIFWADGDEFHQKKSVVEEEITIANKLRIIPIETNTNNGIGFVVLT